MLRRIKIWSVHPFPFQKPPCSLLRCWSTVSAVRWMMILARILLGTDSKVIPRDLLQFLRAPFFRIFTMAPSVRSSGNFFSSQMSLRSGWSRSAASCGSALNTSAPRLSCQGDFSFSRDLMAALIFSWGISVDIQVSRCLLYICFFWWWFVCSEFHPVLLCPACYIFCLACKLVHEYLLVCSCHSLHYLARFPLLLIYLSFSWPQRLSSSEFFCLQWLLRYPLWSTSSSSSALFYGRLCRSARRLSSAVTTLYWCLSSLPASGLQHLPVPGTYSAAEVWRQSLL